MSEEQLLGSPITPSKYVVIFCIWPALYLEAHCSVALSPHQGSFYTSKVVVGRRDVPSCRRIAKPTVNQVSQADVLYDKYGACYLVTLVPQPIQNKLLTLAILTQHTGDKF